jgi:hypothetical protein
MMVDTRLPPEAERILQESGQRQDKAADDWLAAFSKKSEEVLAKRAAEKNVDGKPPDEKALVRTLARKDHTEYDRVRSEVAEVLGIRVGTLDEKVEAIRTEWKADEILEPHWKVEPAAEAVDAAQLFAAIEARLQQHVVMPKDLAFVVALWIGQSWVHEHAIYSPILGVTSAERDSGKSTLMAVIGFLVRRSVLSVGISAAALYRSIEKWHPTFVLDECDELFVDNPELLRVVNSGWTRGQTVLRCEPETNEPKTFSTFCPKAIALKGKKMLDTMLSRTIFIEMKRRLRSEKVDHFRHLDDPDFQRMRSQLARWAQDCGETLSLVQPAQPEGFMNRMASNWQLMFAIADSLGDEAGARARAIAQQIAGVTDMASAGVALLREIKTMFEASSLDYLTSKAVISNLTSDPEKQWAEWSRSKPITEKGVAQLLREYRIISRNVGSRDAQTKGYRKADFEDAWKRYLTPEAEDTSEGGLDSAILPSTRPRPCDDYTFSEKTAVHQRAVDGKLPSTAGSVDGSKVDFSPAESTPWTRQREKRQNKAPLKDTGSPRRPQACAYCGSAEPSPNQVAFDGLNVWLHSGCEAAYLGQMMDDGIPDILRRRPS